METKDRSLIVRYGAAVLAVVAGFLLRSILNPLLGTDSPFITFFPAVALSALIGGFGPGIVATLLGGLIANFFVMPDNLTFSFSQPKDLSQVVVFLAMGGFISWAVSERERIQARLKRVQTESEEALRESEERSLLAQRFIGVGIWEWNLKTEEVEWSEGVYDLLGLKTRHSKERFENWLEFIFPEDREQAISKMEQLIAEGETEFYDEFRIIRANDGEVRWIAVQGQIIRDETGEAFRLRGVNYDITGRKETELEIKHLNHELNRRIKELQAIFDIAPVGIAVALDPSCDVIRANPALAEMLGISPGDNISVNSENAAKVPYKHLRDGRELAPEELPMQRAIAEKRPILGEETEILRADGRLITLYGYASPVFDEDENVVSCIAAHIDITERKKGERERERQFDIEQSLRKEAEEANRLKDEFLATISHELRTPLNAILGWISILRRDGRLTDDTRHKAFEAIERGAKSQSQLIEDLLDVSRIISGKLQIDAQPIELISVINAAIETVRPAAEAKGIELQTRIKSSIGLVSGDADRLQQVFWNLLTNAVKFTPKGGKVEVVLQSNDSRVEIIVSDTGKGISPDFLPYVFDRFRQADGSITRHFTGLGLGLSIVKHLVELHGGTVSVTSDGEEKGSTFSVRLPLMDFPDFNEKENKISNAAEGNGFQSNYPALDNVRILIVDDEADTLEILKVVFESCQAEVKTAASAAAAFHTVKEWQPQIIISDIGMPEEDGYSFMRRVRLWEKEGKSDGNLIQAVALTAYAHADDREKALNSGYQMHVAKPVEPVKLASLIESFIKS